MKPLATLSARDVERDAPQFDYDNYSPRYAVRVIVFNGLKIALLKVNLHDYYMLPGGGIDEGEDQYVALTREAKEELGCEVQVERKIGEIITYNDRWRQRQTDYCYIARLIHDTGVTARAANEVEEGHEIVWADNIDIAIQLLENATPTNHEGRLLTARELIILRAAKDQYNKGLTS